MKIGELASTVGVTAKTIRFWEESDLLPEPARTPAGYRDYEPEIAGRLRFIRQAQAAGLTIAEIRQVLTISDAGQPPCDHVTGLLHQHLDDIDARIRQLTGTRKLLHRLAARAADQDPQECDGYCAILRTPDHQA